MNFLRYKEGCKPGVAPKRPATDKSAEEKKRKYEDTRSRTFQPHWQSGRPWLKHEDGAMFCSFCREHSDHGPTTANLKGSDKFVTGCQNFRLTTIRDHEATARHRAVS